MESAETKTIEVVVNGEARSVPEGLSLDRLLVWLAIDPSRVAVAGTVIESERPHRLVLSWTRPENLDDPDKVSRVTFTIEEQFGSTRLTVIHSELDDEMLRAISAGWPPVLSSLKTMLETGASMPMTRKHWKRAN